MICMKCAHWVGECICPDIEERLAGLSASPFLMIKFCKKCNQHHERCKCEAPEFEIRGGK